MEYPRKQDSPDVRSLDVQFPYYHPDFILEADALVTTLNCALSSGHRSGYKIVTPGSTPPFLLQPDSIVAKRAAFVASSLWVTPFAEDQIYPSGKYVPQTRDTPSDSILSWMEGAKPIENQDVVLYLTFGATHIPRPEDWPIMPAEIVRVHLKPISFFSANPALDV